MSRFKVIINTAAFEPFHATHKNWENGTRNDFIYAINGWQSVENNLRDLKNRVCLMIGYPIEEDYYQDKYSKWMKKSKIKYQDRMCGFYRIDQVGVYGIAQGYVDISKHINELRKIGKSKIYFTEAYDVRQYPKNYDGCYIELLRV